MKQEAFTIVPIWDFAIANHGQDWRMCLSLRMKQAPPVKANMGSANPGPSMKEPSAAEMERGSIKPNPGDIPKIFWSAPNVAPEFSNPSTQEDQESQVVSKQTLDALVSEVDDD